MRAGQVAAAEEYPWSIAVARCEGRDDQLLSDSFSLVEAIGHWRSWLAEEQEDESAMAALRRSTYTVRPRKLSL